MCFYNKLKYKYDFFKFYLHIHNQNGLSLFTLSERLYMYRARASAMIMPFRLSFLKSTWDLEDDMQKIELYFHAYFCVSLSLFYTQLYIIKYKN